jgi:hypothetical protein
VGLAVATGTSFAWQQPGPDAVGITLVFAAAISFCFMIVRTPMLARQAERALAAAPRAAAAAGGEPGTPSGPPPAEQVAALIAGRRAIFPKDMNGEAVSRGEIEALLTAANWAPTHKKTQPWRFVVLGERRGGC